VDKAHLGLWFYDKEEPDLEFHTCSVAANAAQNLQIPAGAMNH
jgi:hypothetical protein